MERKKGMNMDDKPTVFIMLGPPGSGKSSLASKLSKDKNIPHISTGDLFYDNVKNDTPLGQKAKLYLDKGQLVPDSLVLDILYDRIFDPDCEKGYILDGIPRNITQVHEMEDYLRHKANVLAFRINVSDDEVISRLSGRLLCPKCHQVYNKNVSPPSQEGLCDACGGDLLQRSDDTPEAIKERLKVYHEQTQPIEHFYSESGALKDLDGQRPIDQIYQELISISNGNS